MPSIRPRLAFAALRRRRGDRPRQDAGPPDGAARRAVELPVVSALPAAAQAWATPPSAAELREELVELEAERALATLHGLDRHGAYRSDLDADIAASTSAYVGTAVVEIALLRARLDGRLQG